MFLSLETRGICVHLGDTFASSSFLLGVKHEQHWQSLCRAQHGKI